MTGRAERVNERALCAAAVAAIVSMIAAPTVAQTGATSRQSADAEQAAQTAGTIEEVFVTARRREERLQDVPLSVASVSAEKLAEQHVISVGELTRVAPALVVLPQGGGGRSMPIFTMRGLSTQETSILSDTSVTAYLGDIVIARVQGLNAALFDVGSVEVLRGPQGTLFGRNTTGGAVVIRPNLPTDVFEGSAALTVGNFDTTNAEAMINVPVGDIWKFRLSGTLRKDDGYVYDELLGRNTNENDQQALRAQVLVDLPGGTSVLTAYDYFADDGGSTPSFIKFANPAGVFNGEAFRADRGYRPVEALLAEQQARGMQRIATGTPLFNDIVTHTVANTITLPLTDAVSFKNIAGYRSVDSELRDDPDGTESSMFPQERTDRYSQFTEEFQLLGGTDRLTWIAGLYYFKENGRAQAESYGAAVDPGPIEPVHVEEYPGPSYSVTDVEGRNKSYAVFAQGTYQLTDRLNLTAGLRYTEDEREATFRNRLRSGCRFSIDDDDNPSTPEVVPPLSECELTEEKSFSEPTYTISLDYLLADNKMAYIAHRHGYRSGGYAPRATTEEGLSRTFKPELVDDFEVGFKADWNLGPTFLRTNLALYYADYEDIQRVLTDPNTTPVQAVTTNAGSARIQGLELELLFQPVPSVTLTADYAYTDAEFKKFIAPNGTDLSGAPFARAPENVYTLGARYSPVLDASFGDVSVGVSLHHIDDYNGTDDYVPGFTEVQGYDLTTVDARWNSVIGSNFDIAAYVTNLTDEDYSSLFVNLNGLGFTSHVAGEPRRYGFTVQYNFGD